ncbi:MAG TPA: DHA2 family efflux MFS transporter permease subunit [Fontimonas sp.]
MSAANSQAQGVPLAGGAKAMVAMALALGTFMQVLDTTIANVSIPTIAGNLGVAPDQGTWVITSFAVANGISVPLTGWLMMRYGVVRTFVVSVLLFTLASLLCGLSWSLESLIAFRVMQGAVSGPMIPGSQALLLALFPPEKKGTALAIWSMTTLVAPICGPLLGGWISDNYSWPWIFLINVPVGIVCAAICWGGLKNSETPTRKLPVDGIGFALLVVWIGALQIVLDTGKDADWFASPHIIALSIVAVVGLIAFLIWELNEEHPIIDLSLFRNRNVVFGTIALCIGYAIFFGNTVLLPLWMQTQLSYTATWAGMVAAPSGVIAVMISPMVGKLIGKVDARAIATFSFVAFGVSYFMRAGYTADADFWSFTYPLLVQGLGMGTFFVAMITISLHGVAPEKIPSASGLTNFLRITAGSFAASITTTFWDRHKALHQTHLAEASTAYDPVMQQALQQMSAQGLTHEQSIALMNHTLSGQAYLLSALDYFWISAWMCLALIAIVWMTRRPMGGAAVAAAD